MPAIQRLLLCSCEGTMETDAESASAALRGIEVRTATALCMSDIDIAGKALAQDGTTV